MATRVRKKNIRKSKKSVQAASPFSIYWEKQNYYLLALGFAIIIIGFYLMSIGNWDSKPSLVISPILLVIGYVLIFPASMLLKKKKVETSVKKEEIDSGKG